MSNPALDEVLENQIVILITEFGKYRVIIGSKTNRATVLRESRTNGAWGYRVDAENYNLTYIHGDAILGVEFPRGGTYDEVDYPETTEIQFDQTRQRLLCHI